MRKNETKPRVVTNPDRIKSYLTLEKVTLLIVSISGILYNIGMVAGPWFEGQLVQRLFDIMTGKKALKDMVSLALIYVAVIAFVQFTRFIKRLYVRKFANHMNRDMKQTLYGAIVHRPRLELEKEGTGNIMTKAISDVDTCVEGIRKFTTEVFDTGVVMIAYIVMLAIYDWRLTILSLLFPPIAYFVAEKLKSVVSKSASAYKKSAGKLNAATMDRISNAMTYRVYGQEKHSNQIYEEALTEYEKKAAFANIWETSLQPIYQIVSTLSMIFILWFGANNVLDNGWTTWNIAAFTTFISCFMKLAVKSSKAAKLFNAVQKAKVSWRRVKPFLENLNTDSEQKDLPMENEITSLHVKHLSFHYQEDEHLILENVNFDLRVGEILGVTGPVACGKSTLGKVFLMEEPYEGNIIFCGKKLSQLYRYDNAGLTAYMGHKPELLSASIEDNILLGSKGDVTPYLAAVCMEDEIAKMPDGISTMIGNGGVRLSGGQQARIALARTLFHRKKLVILDDPFSAVDQGTEKKILENIKPLLTDCMVILISHRLSIFPQLNQVLWMGDGTVASHETLLKEQKEYSQMYELQMGGKLNETK